MCAHELKLRCLWVQNLASRAEDVAEGLVVKRQKVWPIPRVVKVFVTKLKYHKKYHMSVTDTSHHKWVCQTKRNGLIQSLVTGPLYISQKMWCDVVGWGGSIRSRLWRHYDVIGVAEIVISLVDLLGFEPVTCFKLNWSEIWNKYTQNDYILQLPWPSG